MALPRLSNSFTVDEVLFVSRWLQKQALIDPALQQYEPYRSVRQKFDRMSDRALSVPPEASCE